MDRPVIQGLRPPPGSLRISVKTKVGNGPGDNELPHSRAFSRLTQCSPGSRVRELRLSSENTLDAIELLGGIVDARCLVDTLVAPIVLERAPL